MYDDIFNPTEVIQALNALENGPIERKEWRIVDLVVRHGIMDKAFITTFERGVFLVRGSVHRDDVADELTLERYDQARALYREIHVPLLRVYMRSKDYELSKMRCFFYNDLDDLANDYSEAQKTMQNLQRRLSNRFLEE